MIASHKRISKRHRTILRSKLNVTLKKKNLDLVLYLNYLRFINGILKRSNQLCDQDASSEILSRHVEDAGLETMKRFKG